ncbi:hypothetical protein [Blastomonas sp.]|jgi:hypothetical protein|uniref:hypothetical protein n=1 Tax=Blastomonas sp. TaxID=1909299 RepID=UPI00406A4FE2
MTCIFPIRLDSAATEIAARDVLWSILRTCADPISIGEVIRTSGFSPVIVTRCLRKWRKSGLIEQVGRQRHIRLHSIARRYASPPEDVRINPLGQRFTPANLRQRIWTAVRVLKVFEMPMLVMAAETNTITALKYINELVRGGYLERIDPPGARHRKYRIVLNTGPHHPSVNRVVIDGRPYTRIVDHNTSAQIHLALGPRGRPSGSARLSKAAPASPFFDRKD